MNGYVQVGSNALVADAFGIWNAKQLKNKRLKRVVTRNYKDGGNHEG